MKTFLLLTSLLGSLGFAGVAGAGLSTTQEAAGPMAAQVIETRTSSAIQEDSVKEENPTQTREDVVFFYEMETMIGTMLKEKDFIQDASVHIAPPEGAVSSYQVSVEITGTNIPKNHGMREFVQQFLPGVSGDFITIIDQNGTEY